MAHYQHGLSKSQVQRAPTVEAAQMTAKALSSKENNKRQGATLLGPGDFPLGSPQSRAAARLRFQLVGVGGDPAVDCICFPEYEQPSFGFPIEIEIASKALCSSLASHFQQELHSLPVASIAPCPGPPWRNATERRLIQGGRGTEGTKFQFFLHFDSKQIRSVSYSDAAILHVRDD
jgi:hypothetical protein